MAAVQAEDVRASFLFVGDPNAELWLAPLQVARATSAATFSVAPGLPPLLFKIHSAATIAPLVFWPLSRAALIASFISEQNFSKHNCKTRAGETLIEWEIQGTSLNEKFREKLNETGTKHEQPLMQLLGIFPS